MSFIFLAEQGGVSSVEDFWGIESYVLSRSNPTAKKSSCNDSGTESFLGSPSGTTFAPSTASRGEESSISCVEDSLAKTSPLLADERDWKVNGLGFGLKCRELLARFDPATCLWKTPQDSCPLFPEMEESCNPLDYQLYSQTWPRWGMTHHGELWELTTPERHIEESESGFWLTPRSTEIDESPENFRNRMNTKHKNDRKNGFANLTQQVKYKWPTPCAHEPGTTTEGYGRRLAELVEGKEQIKKKWPTPNCSDAKNPGGHQHQNDLSKVVLWATPTTMDTLPPKSEERLMYEATVIRPGRSRPSNLRDQVTNGHLWPTPRASIRGDCPAERNRHSPDLAAKVVMAEEEKKEKWPTPCTQDFKRRGPNSSQQGLCDVVGKRVYPTPATRDYKGINSRDHVNAGRGRSHMDQLPNYVKYVAEADHTFPTPGTTGLSNGSGNCEKANRLHQDGLISEEERRSFRAGNGGSLNPDWVEWLMGWPVGWTSVEPLDLESFRQWDSRPDWWAYDPADYEWLSCGIVPRTDVNIKNRIARIKAIGNGQVPQAVVLAWSILSREVRI